ncbi:MAG: hypothetical protein DRJ02_06820 [Bacteroidetes bacterium]|nr:MAG: hypothetical protein DRJ02_06820 [Bacteroidota bacterium]
MPWKEITKMEQKIEFICECRIMGGDHFWGRLHKDLVFGIISNNQTGFSSILKINSVLIECDGYNSILTNSDTEKIVPLNEDFDISETSYWTRVHDLSLDDFAGKGEKYIGYRSCFFSSGRPFRHEIRYCP